MMSYKWQTTLFNTNQAGSERRVKLKQEDTAHGLRMKKEIVDEFKKIKIQNNFGVNISFEDNNFSNEG